MDDSILVVIKQMLGIEDDYDAFDTDVIIAINSALFSLMQIGVVPAGSIVNDETLTWSDILRNADDLEGVKMYVYLKARIVFDPPSTSAVLDALHKQMNELEWRLLIQVEEGRAYE